MLTEQMPRPLVRHLQASFPPGWKLPVQFEVKTLDLVLNVKKFRSLKSLWLRIPRAIKHMIVFIVDCSLRETLPLSTSFP